jgi:hypothetical protein
MRRSSPSTRFWPGRLMPLDRNAKVRVMMVARALMRATRRRARAYGKISAKALAVLTAKANLPGVARRTASLYFR